MTLTGPISRAFGKAESVARKLLLWAGIAWAAFVAVVLGVAWLVLDAFDAPAWSTWLLVLVALVGVGAYVLLYAYARFQLAAVRETVETAVEVEDRIRGFSDEP